MSMECECFDGVAAVCLNGSLGCEYFCQKCRGSVSSVTKGVDKV